MATLTLGTGATLKSTTVEAAIIELLNFIKIHERVSIENPNSQDNVRVLWSSVSRQYTGTFSLPCTFTKNELNVYTPRCINYFQNLTYSSGSAASELVSQNPLQDLMDLILRVQELEADPSKNATSANNVTADVLSEPYRFEGSYTLDTTEVINVNGSVSYPVKPYLT